jgi:hypothetical protein
MSSESERFTISYLGFNHSAWMESMSGAQWKNLIK